MAQDGSIEPTTAETREGAIEYVDRGAGPTVLFIHGSPGGSDQGVLMTEFLVAVGFRVITPSRPGYLGTPLTGDRVGPDQQADLERALMDSLAIDRFGLMCWSGGGPSAYRLAVRYPDRVGALVAIAAVSRAYTFASGIEESLMAGRFGAWMIKEMEKHAPRSLVKSTVGEEGDLSKQQLKELTEQIWQDETKRRFVLGLADTVTYQGRQAGLDNDHEIFPTIDDLQLSQITTPTLLVHGTVDSDVPPGYSDYALGAIPGAEIVRVEGGTHIAVWTDPTSDALHERIATFLRP
ncbi:MAG: alpha/beta fold hydrolase [Acidimicrobiales bacterium]